MGNIQEQIGRLLEKRAELDARLATARAFATRQERRDESRRKIIAGAMMFRINGCDWAKVGEQLRLANMLNVRDYPLFGLIENQLEPKADNDSPISLPWREITFSKRESS